MLKYRKYYKNRKVSNMEDKKEKLPSTNINWYIPTLVNFLQTLYK